MVAVLGQSWVAIGTTQSILWLFLIAVSEVGVGVLMDPRGVHVVWGYPLAIAAIPVVGGFPLGGNLRPTVVLSLCGRLVAWFLS